MKIKGIRRRASNSQRKPRMHALRDRAPRQIPMCKERLHGKVVVEEIDVAELDCEECRAAVAALAIRQPTADDLQQLADAISVPWAWRAK